MERIQTPIFERQILDERFKKLYGTDADCHKSLVRIVWPKGFICRRCAHTAGRLEKNGYYVTCRLCRTRHTPTAGTPLHGTRTNLSKWFLVLYLATRGESKAYILSVADALDVDPKTIRRWLRKIDGLTAHRFKLAFLKDLKPAQ